MSTSGVTVEQRDSLRDDYYDDFVKYYRRQNENASSADAKRVLEHILTGNLDTEINWQKYSEEVLQSQQREKFDCYSAEFSKRTRNMHDYFLCNSVDAPSSPATLTTTEPRVQSVIVDDNINFDGDGGTDDGDVATFAESAENAAKASDD
jgi:hypothetical protein